MELNRLREALKNADIVVDVRAYYNSKYLHLKYGDEIRNKVLEEMLNLTTKE